MNKNFEMKKNNAASVLTDEILDIFNKLEKAMTLSPNVTEEYFLALDPGDKEDMVAIRVGFEKVGLYAEMLEDYLFEAKKATLELVARSRNVVQEIDE
ncbi:hypothetical protein [Proteiniclasticum sp.]|uniref:hypothetical protein n=1 Tax=Proteiniclasticum sp. TaxID=2053595 RepID=UPI00289CBF6F|nr:hypothetical protein [Proteiniclasticum sp.]